MAGINAGLKIRKERPFVLGRDEAYIGVLIDDLVTKGVEEPYRLFTSRAEYRLSLRADNADRRLMHYGKRYGLIGETDFSAFQEKREKLRRLFNFLQKEKLTIGNKARITLKEWLKKPHVSLQNVLEYKRFSEPLTEEDMRFAEAEVKYEGYLRRQAQEVERIRRMDSTKIPDGIDFQDIPGLTREVVEKLKKSRPRTIGLAKRIPGITPAAVVNLSLYLKVRDKAKREPKFHVKH
jgi:tRNA uridine 5-carboxymethylaminomethyl modification enzyme